MYCVRNPFTSSFRATRWFAGVELHSFIANVPDPFVRRRPLHPGCGLVAEAPRGSPVVGPRARHDGLLVSPGLGRVLQGCCGSSGSSGILTHQHILWRGQLSVILSLSVLHIGRPQHSFQWGLPVFSGCLK